MMNRKYRLQPEALKWVIFTMAGGYVLIHLFTLSRHPFIHSDETWLAVLTRAMIAERSPTAVEEVFRQTDRFPHALKTIYHLIQAPFLALSWSAYAARLPSLIAGLSVLVLTTLLAGQYKLGRHLRFIPAGLMALDPQFWYVSHLGRQEMILTALFLWSWYLKKRKKRPWLAMLPLAGGIFVHPNTFVIALPIAMMFVVDAIRPGNRISKKLKELLLFFGFLAIAAMAAVGISFLMDPDFLRHYLAFGDSVGTGDSLVMKLMGLPRFFGKMWMGTAGTYYLADVRPMLVIGILGLFGTAITSKRSRPALELLLVPFALAVGMAVVGKYSPPTIAFLIPAAYLLFGSALSGIAEIRPFILKKVIPKRSERNTLGHFRASAGKAWFHTPRLARGTGSRLSDSGSRALPWGMIPFILGPILVAGLVLTFSTVNAVIESVRMPSYSSYIRFIDQNVGKQGRVLSNLNTAFAFDYDRLVIWRDLAGTAQLEQILDDYDVQWIVVPEELKLIYESRPVWNGIYGNPAWYPDLREILDTRGTLIAEGSFPNYAMRIVPFMDRADWRLRIYRID
jgi:hypothetical protein